VTGCESHASVMGETSIDLAEVGALGRHSSLNYGVITREPPFGLLCGCCSWSAAPAFWDKATLPLSTSTAQASPALPQPDLPVPGRHLPAAPGHGDTPRLPLPTDLSVSCRNLETVLYWNYTHAVRRPLFSVEIWSYTDGVWRAVEKCTNVTRRHCDVSSSITDLSDTYALCVKAAAGSEVSKVTSESLLFRHVHKFTCNQKVCEAKFPFIEEKDQHCILVKGTVDYLIFNSSQICTEEQPEKPVLDIIKITVIVISLTVSVVVLLLVIGWFVFQYLTKRRVSLPKSLVSRLKPGFRPEPTLGRGEEHISQVSSVGTSPSSTPLIQECKTNSLTRDSSLDDCLRFKIGPENCGELNETLVVALPEETDHGLSTEEGQSVSAVMDQQDSRGSADFFTTGFNSSGYDRPKVLTVEMGPGDTAEGYSHTQL
ncbi:INGR1 protein, partial [Atractosteus spatula]|nr:INGR1 protein [Atractosteus spatula]